MLYRDEETLGTEGGGRENCIGWELRDEIGRVEMFNIFVVSF